MQPSLKRGHISKHVQFTLEPQVQIINNHYYFKNKLCKDTTKSDDSPVVEQKQIPNPTSTIQNRFPTILNVKLINSEKNSKLQKKKLQEARANCKSMSKCSVILLKARNNNCDDLTEFAVTPCDSDAVYNLHTTLSERNRVDFPVGLELFADSFARWLCNRQVSNAIHFYINIQQQRTADSQRRRLFQHQATDLTSSSASRRCSRSPRTSLSSSSSSSVPTTTITANLAQPAVHIRYFKRSDGLRRLGRMPQVTTLLRACRDADEELLLTVFQEIAVHGISKAALNEADCSGRTAVSYICSTNLTHMLDAFLQIPGIDINLADREGNTPLHYAAQAGQSEIINMLLTRSRSISIDAKNLLGFTPLMKAALQGRTRCAKLLLFAGASPIQTDNGRKLRPEEWARFCGRLTCAEMIRNCAKVRMLEQSTAPLTSPTSPPTPPKSTSEKSIRSKLRRVLTFALGEDKIAADQNKNDQLNLFASKVLSASEAMFAKGYDRPFHVPRLQVTPVNAFIQQQDDATTETPIRHARNITASPPSVPPRNRVRPSH